MAIYRWQWQHDHASEVESPEYLANVTEIYRAFSPQLCGGLFPGACAPGWYISPPWGLDSWSFEFLRSMSLWSVCPFIDGSGSTISR